MKAWIIYNKQDAAANKSFIEWFINEADRQSIQLGLVCQNEIHIEMRNNNPEIFINGQQKTRPDFAIFRTRELFLRKQFELAGIPVFNNSEVGLICNHKALTYMTMTKLGLPVPDTIALNEGAQSPKEIPFAFPFVMKAAQGHGGTEVYLVKNETEWFRLLKYKSKQDYIIQSTAHIQLGIDIRVFIVGKKIIAAVKRINKDDFRANFKLGGSAEIFDLTEKMKTDIQKVINYFDFGMAGIDFLLTNENKLLFNEIEDVAGSRILSATTEINIAKLYLKHIKNTLYHGNSAKSE